MLFLCVINIKSYEMFYILYPHPPSDIWHVLGSQCISDWTGYISRAQRQKRIPHQVVERDTRGGGSVCAMNLWLLVCLVASLMGAWSTVHTQGVSEDCCLAYHHRARPRLLMRAQGYQRQEVSGSCNLPAVIFFFPKNKMLCVNPRVNWLPNVFKFLDNRNNTHSKQHLGSRRNLQDSHLGGQRSNTGMSRLAHSKSKSSRSTRSNKKKTSFLNMANPGP
uniref:C-C motif chemokine n=2 Tax=Canis lupus familiaris TaxID=9615 RepID=A0A8C0NAR5_CANLF